MRCSAFFRFAIVAPGAASLPLSRLSGGATGRLPTRRPLLGPNGFYFFAAFCSAISQAAGPGFYKKRAFVFMGLSSNGNQDHFTIVARAGKHSGSITAFLAEMV